MALFRKIRNTLFGQTNTTQQETASMLGTKLQKGAKLTTGDNDLFLEDDPLSFDFLTYPQNLNTIGNGHYIKFDIYENTLSRLTQAPPATNPFDISKLNIEDVSAADVGSAIARLKNSKAQEPNKGQVAGDDDDGGKGAQIEGSTKKLLKDVALNKGFNSIRRNLKTLSPSDINEGLDLHSHTHNKQSKGSILLYTSPTNKFTTQANYENAETGFLSDFLGGGSVFDNLGRGGAMAATKLTGAAITTALEIMVPGAGGFFNRSSGMAVNPNTELAFKSVPFRSFQFDYKFAPKNRKELNQVHKIIQMFRFHMSPALIGQTQYFASPSQFMLTYMYRQDENNYIPKIAKCVLETIDVDYSPGEKFTTLKPDNMGASPQVITMNLTFKEMSIITKETIAEGY